MRSRLILAAILLLVATRLVLASSTPYEPPEGGDKWQYSTVILKGTGPMPQASGKAILACNMGETQHRLQLSAQKVRAGGVYSVWLVLINREGKVLSQKRTDDPKRPLKADRYGKVAFTANLPFCPQGRYSLVVVRYHADRNPNNVQGAQTALKGLVP